jgi:nucleotide-binding universal stress UspA family protein
VKPTEHQDHQHEQENEMTETSEYKINDIVVGVDGSDGSLAALRWSARTAKARGARVRAISAWQYPAHAVTPAGPARLPDADEMDRQTCEELGALIRRELGDDAGRVDAEAGRGPAATVLITAARTADLLVVGARGLGGFSGLLLGSASQQCVEHSPCPVVVLRGGTERTGGPIVVGLDGSDGAASALAWSAAQAEATGTSVVAVHALGAGPNNTTMDAAHAALERWCAPIEERSIRCDRRVVASDPRTALDDVADATGASLIVVGSRGLGAVRGLLLGSVAGYVARYATRPIAVIPRAATS